MKAWFKIDEGESTYWLTRYWFLKGLSVVYLCAFVPMLWQLPGLIGSRGITPLERFMPRVLEHFGEGPLTYIYQFPTVFWIDQSDIFILSMVWLGIILSLLVLAGRVSGLLLFILWLLQLSFSYAGQLWYAFGWEMNLLELGFLSIFLVPFLRLDSFDKQDPPPLVIIYLIRWCLFRLVLGAGLIKLRGDSCWSDLTCLAYHFETQPVPSPLSWFFHQMPLWSLKAGVLFNHFVELIIPLFILYPNKRLRHGAGYAWLLFQLVLMASGNLGWINILAIVNALVLFDDSFLRKFSPLFLIEKYELYKHRKPSAGPIYWARYFVCLQVALLSIKPVSNLINPSQVMNKSYDPYHLVNTYGMFGGVTKKRYEIEFEATMDGVTWKPYIFKCKPGPLDRAPCFMSPSHYRLDWQIWFAAMAGPSKSPWLQEFSLALLMAEPSVLKLLDSAPFDNKKPRAIRAQYYLYTFTKSGEKGWWSRAHQGLYLTEMSLGPN